MGKYRKRFNEKARSGMVARQLALKRSRQKSFNVEPDQEEPVLAGSIIESFDPNAEILHPMSAQEKEEKKRKLEESLKPTESKISNAKRKRLDKYIDKQIRKQEAVKLLEEISKNKVDLSNLKSLKTLGSRGVTKREKMEEALELERLGQGNEETREMLYEEREIKDWRQSDLFNNEVQQGQNGPGFESGKSEQDEPEGEQPQSTFIDKRPQSMGGHGFGLSITADPSKKKLPYNWKAILEKAKAQKEGKESDSSSEEEVDDYEEDEWSGFNDSDIENVEENSIRDSSDDEEDLSSEEELSEGESDDESEDDKPSKGQQFKDWASSNLNASEEKLETPEFQGTYIPLDRQEDRDEIPNELTMQSAQPWRKSYFVQVTRSEELEHARIQLPVVREEQRIMEAIHNNNCIVICGETGSGKTTQVPQFLFEAGYGSPESSTPGMIAVTQPRRVAAVSMAKRVASELGEHGNRVAYQIRFDANVKSDTALKFMTDGILLRELSNDFALKKYSVIIIDEAHERNINTDILIGVLSRVQKLRADMHSQGDSIGPLKLIIMSATLRVSDFTQNTRLFPTPPPVLKVEARQYPVSVHFNRRTHHEYLEEAYKKAVKIHQRLPPGGILIFLTGQNEISQLCKRLRKQFPFKQKSEGNLNTNVRVDARESVTEIEDIDFGVENASESSEEDEFREDSEDEEGFDEQPEEGQDLNAPLHVLPLYSLLPTTEQLKVFENPPDGSRLCVVATNVAETSLTIPGIRYVVDCGRSKERHYDEESGVQSFKVSWTSKASADQRSGRAGRTGPGHCYRLFSSAVYENDFTQFSEPEILRIPIEALVLQMKSMGIHNILNFPFPTLPSETNLSKGLRLLKYLGALDATDALTDLGKTMSLFPLSPRFSKILIIGNQQGCLPYITALVAALSVGDPFLGEQELGISTNETENTELVDLEAKEEKRNLRQQYFKVGQKFSSLDSKSDVLKLLSAVCAFDFDENKAAFSRSHFLRLKSMEEIQKLRHQIAYIVAVNTRPDNVESTVKSLTAKQKPPSAVQLKAIKQMIAAGFIDQIALRADLASRELDLPSKTRIASYPYVTLFPVKGSTDSNGCVYIHPQSVLAQCGEIPPDFLVYNYISKGATETAKLRMKLLTDVTASQLSNVAKNTSLITYSKPLGPPHAPKMLSPVKRECWVIPRMGAAIGSGGVGWDLPVKRVIQEKKSGNWVVI
jgi:ATP-dependent RNA helicase DHX37/DHR1